MHKCFVIKLTFDRYRISCTILVPSTFKRGFSQGVCMYFATVMKISYSPSSYIICISMPTVKSFSFYHLLDKYLLNCVRSVTSLFDSSFGMTNNYFNIYVQILIELPKITSKIVAFDSTLPIYNKYFALFCAVYFMLFKLYSLVHIEHFFI